MEQAAPPLLGTLVEGTVTAFHLAGTAVIVASVVLAAVVALRLLRDGTPGDAVYRRFRVVLGKGIRR